LASTKNNKMQPLVLTIGHSTRPIDVFTGLLESNGVKHLVDVRTIPRSRHNPQFNSDALADSLREAGIAYTHIPGLGGLRRTSPDSINGAWRNASFRGYADYMQTAEFAANLERVIEMARSERVALMCAEAVPWRCHRSLIADALLARGIDVEEIVSETRRQEHKLTPFARVDGSTVTYPAIDASERAELARKDRAT
jgi:uncharacterized protein (DUF488 family)